MILLTGVLALSWRLDNDSATRPPVSHNALTPGLGFVDDESSDGETPTPTPIIDEEAALLNKESPYGSSDPLTPTTKNNDLLTITRLRRKGTVTEREEIWDELEDDAPTPLSPFSIRRSSMRSTSNPTSKRTSRFDLPDVEETPSESSALLARSGTGRSYRDHRRRRSAPGFEARERERRRRSASSQEALGGWWKMHWWKGDKKGKGKKDLGDGGDGEGSGQ